MSKKYMIPGNTSNILNKILYNYVRIMFKISMDAIYFDLREKYESERRLFKGRSGKLTFLEKVYKSYQKLNISFSNSSRIIDKIERMEAVEKVCSENAYKINNFAWKVSVTDAKDHEHKEILSKALESYEDFLTAINSGTITIDPFFKIRDKIYFPMDSLNSILHEKLKNNEITFSVYAPDIGDINDIEEDRIVDEYSSIINGAIPEGIESNEELYLIKIDAIEIFLYDYYLELKKMVLRLFNSYLNYESYGGNVDNPNKYDITNMCGIFHYFNLYDEQAGIKADDEYATTLASLPRFYSVYLNSLINLLVESVNQVDEFDELNEEKRRETTPEVETPEPVIEGKPEKIDYNELTLKLLHNIKKPGNQE